jgi:hypothetical protein
MAPYKIMGVIIPASAYLALPGEATNARYKGFRKGMEVRCYKEIGEYSANLFKGIN